MKPEQLIGFIGDKLDTSPDYPFSGDRESAVFRHRGNRKWFALLMRGIPRGKLGGGEGKTDVVNLKCDPLASGSVRGLPGVYPAYHMNKEHWIFPRSAARRSGRGGALRAGLHELRSHVSQGEKGAGEG